MVQPEGNREAQRSASIHYLPQAFKVADEALDREALGVRVRIENYPHIRRAYGEDVARIVLREVYRRLAIPLCGEGFIVPEENGSFDLLISGSQSQLPYSLHESDLPQRWVEGVCREISLDPIATAHGAIHVWVAAEFHEASVLRPGESVPGVSVNAGFCGDPPNGSSDWGSAYRTDMSAAFELIRAMTLGREFSEGGHFGFAWQPVRDAEDPAIVLYYEALARRFDGNGGSHSIFSALQAVEHIGFVRMFDRSVVLHILDEIENSTSDISLAVNISARSAVCDPLWDDVFTRLRDRADVARRLIVEITETTAILDASETVHFIERLRRFGCRIAIDGFGVGHASVRTLFALAPDIVKIDKFFLAWASIAEAQRETLRYLIGLVESLGFIPIVEGVESAEGARIAGEAGARWQQGYHWGAPSFCRSWMSGGGDAVAHGPLFSGGLE